MGGNVVNEKEEREIEIKKETYIKMESVVQFVHTVQVKLCNLMLAKIGVWEVAETFQFLTFQGQDNDRFSPLLLLVFQRDLSLCILILGNLHSWMQELSFQTVNLQNSTSGHNLNVKTLQWALKIWKNLGHRVKKIYPVHSHRKAMRSLVRV